MKQANKIAFYSTRLSVVLLLLFAFNSCIKEPVVEHGGASNLSANLAVTLNSRAEDGNSESGDANKNENAINRVRILVIGADGSYWNGKVTCNQTFEIQNDNLTVNAKSRAGNSHIYVIANETEQLAKLLNNVTTASEFEEAIIAFIPLAENVTAYNDMPMMAKQTSILRAEVESNNITAKLDRLYAKIRIRLKAGTSDGVDYSGKVTLSSVQLMSIPKYSFLVENKQYPIGGEFQNGTIIPKEEVINGTLTDAIELYAPEYMIGSNSGHCSLVIRGVQTGTALSCVYRIALGENPKNDIPDYNIKRNMLYDITGTIKGFGSGDVDVEMLVSKWNAADASGVVGVRFNKGTVSLTHNEVGSDFFLHGEDFSQIVLQSTSDNLILVFDNTTGKISVNVDITKIGALMETITKTETETEIGKINVLYKGKLLPQSVAVMWKPALVARFAAGYLCHNGGLNQAPYIGSPSEVGIVFKWGSLIGMSMVNAPGANLTSIQGYLAYMPAGCAVSQNIEFRDVKLVGKNNGINGYNMPSADDPVTATGDICRYALGSKWRIPTKADMTSLLSSATFKRSNVRSDWPLSTVNAGNIANSLNGFFIGKNANDGAVNDANFTVSGADPIINQTLFMRSLGCRDDGALLSAVYGADREMPVWTSTAVSAIPEQGRPHDFGANFLFNDGTLGSTVVIGAISPSYGFSIRCIRN